MLALCSCLCFDVVIMKQTSIVNKGMLHKSIIKWHKNSSHFPHHAALVSHVT